MWGYTGNVTITGHRIWLERYKTTSQNNTPTKTKERNEDELQQNPALEWSTTAVGLKPSCMKAYPRPSA